MTELAQRVLDTTALPQFKGDMVLAYLWNSAAAVLGYVDIPSSAVGAGNEDLRRDIEVVLSREAYQGDSQLQALRAA